MIMSPSHPDWKSYRRLLATRLKARAGVYGQPCSGTLLEAVRILEQLSGRFLNIDIPQTITFFRNNGAYCDCEVLLNIPVSNMIGKTYFERGNPVIVLVKWNGKGPRNVLIQRQDGIKVVRPFRGLRKQVRELNV